MEYSQNYSLPKQTADGVVAISHVRDSRHIVFSVHADVSTTATIKAVGSAQRDAVDFADPSASDNDWGYIGFRDLSTASLISGATGITISAGTHHKLYEVESNVLEHFGLELSSVSGDGVSFNIVVKDD